jgi:hypothetical protein
MPTLKLNEQQALVLRHGLAGFNWASTVILLMERWPEITSTQVRQLQEWAILSVQTSAIRLEPSSFAKLAEALCGPDDEVLDLKS